METGPIVSEGGSIDTTTVTVVVTALVSAITALSGLLYRRLLQENAELKQENERLRTTLGGYEQAAPNLVAVIERWMHALEQSSGSLPQSDDTSSTVSKPLPLPRSRQRPKRP
jgi:hypothetical protein